MNGGVACGPDGAEMPHCQIPIPVAARAGAWNEIRLVRPSTLSHAGEVENNGA